MKNFKIDGLEIEKEINIITKKLNETFGEIKPHMNYPKLGYKIIETYFPKFVIDDKLIALGFYWNNGIYFYDKALLILSLYNSFTLDFKFYKNIGDYERTKTIHTLVNR
jgi:hypothetical protein